MQLHLFLTAFKCSSETKASWKPNDKTTEPKNNKGIENSLVSELSFFVLKCLLQFPSSSGSHDCGITGRCLASFKHVTDTSKIMFY